MDENEKKFRRFNRNAPELLRETEYHAPVRYYSKDPGGFLWEYRTALAVVLALVCLAVLLTWYLWPVHRTESFTACTLEGETAQVELDLTVRWRLFRPREVNVALTWDGVLFTSRGNTQFDWLKAFRYLGQNVQDKWVYLCTGNLHLVATVRDEEQMIAWASGRGTAADALWVYCFPQGYMFQPPTEEQVSRPYYAPAATAEEARAQAARWK